MSLLIRARVLGRVDAPGAAEAANEANLALHSLGIRADGWRRAIVIDPVDDATRARHA